MNNAIRATIKWQQYPNWPQVLLGSLAWLLLSALLFFAAIAVVAEPLTEERTNKHSGIHSCRDEQPIVDAGLSDRHEINASALANVWGKGTEPLEPHQTQAGEIILWDEPGRGNKQQSGADLLSPVTTTSVRY